MKTFPALRKSWPAWTMRRVRLSPASITYRVPLTIRRLQDCVRSLRGSGPPAVPRVMSRVPAAAGAGTLVCAAAGGPASAMPHSAARIIVLRIVSPFSFRSMLVWSPWAALVRRHRIVRTPRACRRIVRGLVPGPLCVRRRHRRAGVRVDAAQLLEHADARLDRRVSREQLDEVEMRRVLDEHLPDLARYVSDLGIGRDLAQGRDQRLGIFCELQRTGIGQVLALARIAAVPTVHAEAHGLPQHLRQERDHADEHDGHDHQPDVAVDDMGELVREDGLELAVVEALEEAA